MSAIRYFDNVPHIVRYGSHDDKTEKSWIWFWRNGVRFQIFVDKEDVRGTPFYEQWKPLLREHEQGQVLLSQWMENQWHPMCDLLISTAMPTLNELAPNREHWATLYDYLHTPAYRLRLLASGPQSQVEARIEDGPTDTGAYELEPVSQDKLPLSAGIHFYRSQDLHVLNREKDWRRGPQKISTKDGNVFFFLGCQSGSRDATTQQISSKSLDAIRAQLKLIETHAGALPLGGISQVYGIVTDCPSLDDHRGPSQLQTDESEQRIAGILLTWIPQGKNLVKSIPALAALEDIEAKLKIRAWTERIGGAIKYLHNKGVYLGGRSDWRYLNQYTVLVDSHGQPWLDVSCASWVADMSAEEAKESKEADDVALIHLFVDWLPQEVAQERNSA